MLPGAIYIFSSTGLTRLVKANSLLLSVNASIVGMHSSLSAANLSEAKVLAALLIFLVSYLVFAVGRLPGLKIDRPGAAIIGAVLMVALGIVPAQSTFQFIDFSTLVLLFCMMLVVSNLRMAGFFDWSAGFFLRRLRRAQLLPAIIFISGFLSAFFVNDIICLAMVPLVLVATRRMGLRPERYLLAVATASNIGSVATITGNPQNILIGSFSGIRFFDFLTHLAPVAIVGLLVDWAVLHWLDRRQDVPVSQAEEALPALPLVRGPLIKSALVAVFIVVGFLAGIPPAMVAAIGAAILLVTRRGDPRNVYKEVNWGLLVLFSGLFIIVGGAQQAGLAGHFLVLGQKMRLTSPAVFVAFTAVLGNIVSNVPAVMLLRPIVPALGNPHQMWLLLAMASTLAGNLTITGSLANIIVIETAGPEAHISFRDYFRVGLPITVLTLVLGTAWLWWIR